MTAEFFLKVQRFIFLHPTQHRHMDKISLRRKFIAGSGLIKAAQSSEIMKGTASFRLSSWQIWQDNMPFDPRIFSIAVNEMIPKEVWSLIWPGRVQRRELYIYTHMTGEIFLKTPMCRIIFNWCTDHIHILVYIDVGIHVVYSLKNHMWRKNPKRPGVLKADIFPNFSQVLLDDDSMT